MSKRTNSKKSTKNIKSTGRTPIKVSEAQSLAGKRQTQYEKTAQILWTRLYNRSVLTEGKAEAIPRSVQIQVFFGEGNVVWYPVPEGKAGEVVEQKGRRRVRADLGFVRDDRGYPVWRLTIPFGFSNDVPGALAQLALGVSVIAYKSNLSLSETDHKSLETKGLQVKTYPMGTSKKPGAVKTGLMTLGYSSSHEVAGAKKGIMHVGPSASNSLDYLEASTGRITPLSLGSNIETVTLVREVTIKAEKGEKGDESGSTATLDFGTSEARKEAMDALGASSVADLQRIIMAMVQGQVDGSKGQAGKLHAVNG